MDLYAKALRAASVATSGPPGRPQLFRDNGAWVESREELYVLLLGKSFVVAERFEADRMQIP